MGTLFLSFAKRERALKGYYFYYSLHLKKSHTGDYKNIKAQRGRAFGEAPDMEKEISARIT